MLPMTAVAAPIVEPAFESGSALHLLSVGVCVAAVAGAITLGGRWRRTAPERERAMRVVWVVALVAFQAMQVAWWLLPDNFNIRRSLPIHVCDIAPWAAPFALLMSPSAGGFAGFCRAMLYFWGIALSLWGFVTPVIREGPESPVFWLFWISHTQIVGSAVYLVAVMEWRPARRDLLVATLALLAYNAVITPINALTGLDYGYTGPDAPAGVARAPPEARGRWPLRVAWVTLGELGLFVLRWAPWAWRRRSVVGG